MPLPLLLPLLAQVGMGGALPQAPLRLPHTKEPPPVSQSAPAAQAYSPLQQCLKLAMERPADGIDMAETWLAKAATQTERAGALQCKALGLTRIDGWNEAAGLFLAARDATPANEAAERARLAALGGNALLAAGDPSAALGALDLAHADAVRGKAGPIDGEIQIDRARALVALARPDEGASALQQARALAPDNAQAWLLSATLSRRQGKLAEAQSQIERAADLMPVDAEIGLEAGVIALLSGHEAAARKSWQSVLLAEPGSAAAKTAQAYLDQLGAPPAQSHP